MKESVEQRIKESLSDRFERFEPMVDNSHWEQINTQIPTVKNGSVSIKFPSRLLIIMVFALAYLELGDDLPTPIGQHGLSSGEVEAMNIRGLSKTPKKSAPVMQGNNSSNAYSASYQILENEAATYPSTSGLMKSDPIQVPTYKDTQLEKIQTRRLAQHRSPFRRPLIISPILSVKPDLKTRRVSWQFELGLSLNFANLQPNTTDEVIFDLCRDGADLRFERLGMSPTVLINLPISSRLGFTTGVGIHWRHFDISENYEILNEFGDGLPGNQLNESVSIWSLSIAPAIEYSLTQKSPETKILIGLEYEHWVSKSLSKESLLDMPNQEVSMMLGISRQVITRPGGSGYIRGYGYYALNRRHTSGALRVVPYGFVMALGWDFHKN
ncbi:MAG: hypothetical protein RIF33_00915 [Cyclobacteriaceae bacterium]